VPQRLARNDLARAREQLAQHDAWLALESNGSAGLSELARLVVEVEGAEAIAHGDDCKVPSADCGVRASKGAASDVLESPR
jgi:hypothetical protein